MEKRLIQVFVLWLVVVAIFWVWQPFWRYALNEAVDSNDNSRIIFEIEKGSSAQKIASDLEDANLIVSDTSFVRAVKEEDLDQNLRYGKFILSPNMTTRDLITILTTVGTGEMAITVIEGWTVDDIDAKLTDLGLINEGDLRKCTFNCTFDYDFLENSFGLEGFLFPDTYFIDSASFSVEGFLTQMLNNFDNKLTDDMRTKIEKNGRSIQNTVIVASMLEKEVRTEKDTPIVAGIIWKRLDNNWTLGIDATLLYIQDDNEISAEDLTEQSPYNTRINTGLTPTAIGNPGLRSLEGAVYPEASDYWFYLTAPDGEVIYAKTNEEHEENKAEYLD